jgi:hypothetical protein
MANAGGGGGLSAYSSVCTTAAATWRSLADGASGPAELLAELPTGRVTTTEVGGPVARSGGAPPGGGAL